MKQKIALKTKKIQKTNTWKNVIMLVVLMKINKKYITAAVSSSVRS
jgi:hypothetical protein